MLLLWCCPDELIDPCFGKRRWMVSVGGAGATPCQPGRTTAAAVAVIGRGEVKWRLAALLLLTGGEWIACGGLDSSDIV